MTLLPDGKVLIAGGWGTDGPLATAEIYDPPPAGPWRPAPSGRARSGATATAPRGRSGADRRRHWTGHDNGDALATAEFYDPTTGTFRADRPAGHRPFRCHVRPPARRTGPGGRGMTTPMAIPGRSSCTTRRSGRFERGRQAGARLQLLQLELADRDAPARWQRPDRRARYSPRPSATTPPCLRNRRCPPHPHVAPVRFEAVEGPGALRTGHTATRLADGRVLIAGGTDAGTGPALASAGGLDPATGRSSPPARWSSRGPGTSLPCSGMVGCSSSAGSAMPTSPRHGRRPSVRPRQGHVQSRGPHDRREGPHPRPARLRDRRWPGSCHPGGRPCPHLRLGPHQHGGRVIDGDVRRRHWTIHHQGCVGGKRRDPERHAPARWPRAHPHRDPFEPTVQATVYDPVADTWVPLGRRIAGQEFSTTGLPDGRVLVAGGVSYHSVRRDHGCGADSDPGSGTFSATGDMLAARAGHAGTLLPDGSVLITGGYYYSDQEGTQQLAPFHRSCGIPDRAPSARQARWRRPAQATLPRPWVTAVCCSSVA